MAAAMDLGSQIDFVKESLGIRGGGKDQGKEGNGWDGQYELYCVKCHFEIFKPFIDEKDPKRVKRCPKCKESNELWSAEERREQLQLHMDQLEDEEETMKTRKKKWKKFRKKYPIKQQFELLQLGDFDDEKGLNYKEHNMWVAKVDLDEYLDNEYFIPRHLKEVTDRAWDLHDKYKSCKKQMDIAVQQKQKGNDALKDGDYELAIKYYGKSIRARTDYKPSYNNRALAYLKVKKFDLCIAHCTEVINMIQMVDDEMDLSDVNFKAFLRRANAYKMKEDYEFAKADLDEAQKIKPNDGSVKKLMKETKLLHKRVKLRRKLQKQCSNDAFLGDFESVFNLSVEFLEEATSTEEGEWHFETGHSEELLRRLLIFLAKEKKYCVRFADNNGVELSLKYLRKKFKIIKKWKEKLPSLQKPFMLLNYCCEKDVNFNELKKKKLQKMIGSVVLYTFGYFGEMPKDLQGTAMRFVAVVVSIDHVRTFIAEKHGSKLLSYFVKFQKKTSPSKQEAKAIRCLFEALSHLFNTEPLQKVMVAQRDPMLYEVFLHSMLKYNESKTIKKVDVHNEDDRKAIFEYEQLQFSISVLLDGLALLFEGGPGGKAGQGQIVNGTSHYAMGGGDNDDEAKRDRIREEIVAHFVANKNIDKYMSLLREYLHAITKQFKEKNAEQKESDENKKDVQRYFGQLGKCVNVFVSLSRTSSSHAKLFEFDIHEDMTSLIGLCRDPFGHRYDKMTPMLKSCKHNMLVFYDQLSADPKFDDAFSTKFDRDPDNDGRKIPYFFGFICDVFCEEYKERPHPGLMSQFAHFKSCAIRMLFRWCSRRTEQTRPIEERQAKNNIPTKEELAKYGDTYCGMKKISYIMEAMIKKYFAEFCEWMRYNDLQVLANTPLVVRQLIQYSVNMRGKKERPQFYKLVKKQLTLKVLQDIVKLMKTPHEVIQYNSCLLMATLTEMDDEMLATCKAMGAVDLLEAFKRVHEERQRQAQINQMAQQMGMMPALPPGMDY